MTLWKNLIAWQRTSRRNLKRAARRALICTMGAVISRIPLVAIEPIASALWFVKSPFSSNARWSGLERRDYARDVLRLPQSGNRRLLTARTLEKLIDQRLHFGRQRHFAETWPDLRDVARSLAQTIRRLKHETPGRPVIVSPFHYVSQYANIYVIDDLRAQLGLERIGVVSGVPRDLYGSDNAMIPDIDVLYTYDQENRGGLGLQVARSLRRNGVVVIFADVPPYSLSRYPMETVDVSIFGRPARVHNGVFRMGAKLGAVLLPFYLRFDRGRFGGTVLPPIELAAPDAPQRVAQAIEEALTDNYARSLVVGHPSLYAFAPVK
jgi:hypothetical protein